MQIAAPQVIGRYTLFDEIASGGMATVYFARQSGLAGFSRTVAVKRLHKHVSSDPEFVAMFLDEARLASRIRHPNVVATLDVATEKGELIVVMDYVHGEALSGLLRRASRSRSRIPQEMVAAIVSQALHGLHAAHEAKSEIGVPLDLVHRDISPQNILVGVDGLARVVDFGVAKAHGRSRSTGDGAIRGKLAYMPPEQIRGHKLDRRTDVYAMGVVLWEALAGQRMIDSSNQAEAVARVLFEPLPSLREVLPSVRDDVAAIVDRALDRDPANRFATALEMAIALEEAIAPARPFQVGAWVAELLDDTLSARAAILAAMERESAHDASRVIAESRAVTEDLSGPVASVPPTGPVITSRTDAPPQSIHDSARSARPVISDAASPAPDLSRPVGLASTPLLGQGEAQGPSEVANAARGSGGQGGRIMLVVGLAALAAAVVIFVSQREVPRPSAPAIGASVGPVASAAQVAVSVSVPAPATASIPSPVPSPTTPPSTVSAGPSTLAKPPAPRPTPTVRASGPPPASVGCFIFDDKQGIEVWSPNCRK